MVRRGSFIGGQDNLSVPDAPTIGAATAGNTSVSVAFTAPSDVGDDPITGYGASVTDGTTVFNGTSSSSPVTISGLTNGTSYTAQVWAINDYGNGPLSAATSSFSPVAASVGLFMGGHNGSGPVNIVDKIVPESSGDATDFGDLSTVRYLGASFSSDTRSVIAGGYNASSAVNTIEYFTFASAGNATDFGDLSAASYASYGLSNNVRGIVGLGITSSTVNTIESVTIASIGNSIDFGDRNAATYGSGPLGSTTRGVFGGGYTSTQTNVIDYISIASNTNSVDFGDLTVARFYTGGASNNTRGVFFGGVTSVYVNTIDYITIASTGNATDFGDTLVAADGSAGLANSTKAIFGGRRADAGYQNVIQQLTIATTADATDFGDLTGNKAFSNATCSATEAVQVTYNTSSIASAGNIGLFFGMTLQGGDTKVIEQIDINTTGDTAMFGELTTGNRKTSTGGIGSSVRGVLMAGQIADDASEIYSNIIEYVNFHSKGNSTDFGDATVGRRGPVNFSNETRGMAAGGKATGNVLQNVIDYITIASAGNATDFGNLLSAIWESGAATSTTRGLVAGGDTGSQSDVIQYVTIASTGDATDFGDLSTTNNYRAGAVSSNTRAVFHVGGYSSDLVTIEYVTIASTGNTTDFGDLTVARGRVGGLSNGTRGVFGNGMLYAGGNNNTLDYITIASTGDATDFGDAALGTENEGSHIAASNGHGGIDHSVYHATLPSSLGLYAGGSEPDNSVVQSLVSYIDIATDGKAAMFGDLSAPRMNMFSGGMASSTRAVFGGGGISASPYYRDIIDYFTFSTKGNATDFGDTTVARQNGASLSNSTRGLMAGGSAASASNVVDYITIASAGDATDFGDASAAYGQQGATAGTTRGLVAGGAGPVNTIDYYTIASTGNATDFGDLTVARRLVPAGLSSNTRAVFGGGNTGSASDVMDYVTIASTGNATDFGNLTAASTNSSGLSNKTQGLYTAWGSGGTLNVDKITIASTGNATDWGENIHKNYGIGSASNSHGGLS